ncbi:hypothetical protein ACHAP5_002629 [Fusarium lateritium]
MDHIVNANSGPKDAGGYIHGTVDIKAHSGFLNSALALDSTVARMINTYPPKFDVGSGQKPHVVFTGHSAGGAVAQLLYLHHTSHPDLSKSARFSCVTFGAPPCLSSPVDLSLYRPSEETLCVNIINEFDVVTRADKPYILSLIDIARSMLHLPPNNAVPKSATDEEIIYAALKTTDTEDSRFSHQFEGSSIDETKFWRLPQPLYHHVGPRVILLMRLVEGEMSLQAVEVTPSEFQKLLFCRVAVHGKRVYAERVGALKYGRFNSRSDWEKNGHGKDQAS